MFNWLMSNTFQVYTFIYDRNSTQKKLRWCLKACHTYCTSRVFTASTLLTYLDGFICAKNE